MAGSAVLAHLLLVSSLISCAVCGKGGFYSYKVKNIRGKPVSLEAYRGMVSLVVNLASECGYTNEHYKELTDLYNELNVEKKEPFTVLGFPCNQFGQQEPHDNEDIEKFARETYKAPFPLFAKIDVTGTTAHSAYRYLTESSDKNPNWNFWKYLLDGNGKVIAAWGPRTDVKSIKGEVLKAIEKLKLSRREL
ncbi:glutathione peroxidase 7-like [Clavelina lepadiformis]|uniref:Glutathione peroxidase n=1 Tax=Clavelina lepadiformis TaxID=159417 RepID=A0ABP0GR08_CLALP